ncbi:MAG: S8 family serine peptidase [Candidatus Aminicenantes bacterium]|nr:MAG: S8 family serine peptidase [Candidatus Aminicenantes bacterium]
MTKKIVLFPALVLMFFCGWSHSLDQTKKESWERAYAEGRDIFYATLKKQVPQAQLEEADRKKLADAQKRISGLYEHLMNFYYLTDLKNQTKADTSSFTKILAERMSNEFMDSIHSIRLRKETSPLESLLLSIGYYARKSTPQFRKFVRPMTRRAKSQWVLKELEIRQAHTISKGKGIRLAIIDTGVDPTIKEVKGQIADWKNFLDGSKPLVSGGIFPYDWGGHGTSSATVISQIAPEVELMIVKVFDQESMFDAPFTRWNVYQIAAGINWAAKNGADIISLSAAMRLDCKEIRDASEYCWRQNITLISAAGNVEDEQSELPAYYPASYPWSIGVGGVEKKDGKLKVWEHSAKGDYIDVVAPAAEVLVESPSYLDRRSWPTRVSGNSLAVPIVAATTALVLSAMEPEKRQRLGQDSGALVEAARSILRETSSNRKLGYTKPNPESGNGLINAYQAVKKAQVLK